MTYRIRVAFLARYLQAVNHYKLAALSKYPEFDLWHIVPRQWTDSFRTYQLEVEQAKGYRIIPVNTIGKHDIHRFCYCPLDVHLRKIQPDIIHVEEEPDSLAALQVALVRRLLAPKAHLILFTWQNILRKRGIIPKMVARITLNAADYLIAGNTEAARVLRQQGYKGPIQVIPQLGVAPNIYQPKRSEELRATLGLNGFVVGFVGRFVPQKGLDILLKATARMPADVQILLVGGGPMERYLRLQAQEENMVERLTIVSSVPHAEVPKHLNAMDVMVLPSRTTLVWKEQFGHVLIEAMSCGVPVIGSSSGAIPEVIGDAGLIFREDDVAALCKCIEMVRSDSGLAVKMSNAGRQRVQEQYTHQAIAGKTIQVYRTITELWLPQ